MQNTAIIIGIDHPNTLGLLRALGLNGLRPELVLVAPSGEAVYCARSRFVGSLHIVKSYEEAIDYLLRSHHNEVLKPVLFPSADGVEFLIDTHRDALQPYFILPGIGEKQGAVAQLMNKSAQSEWAKENDIPVAETYLIDTDVCRGGVPTPCILKPVLSHEGQKADICKCTSEEETASAIADFAHKGYRRVLVQQFINYDSQLVVHGAMLTNTRQMPHIVLRNLREWPPTGGTGTYREFVTDQNIKDKVKAILIKLQQAGYHGLFDIELFAVGSVLYLNEINFRSSGVGYSMQRNRIYYPYYYYRDAIGQPLSDPKTDYDNRHRVINLMSDRRWVQSGQLSRRQLLKDLIRCRDFALYNRHDPIPALAYLKQQLKSKLHKRPT